MLWPKNAELEADSWARDGRISRSTGCDGNQGGYSHEIYCASHIVSQGGEAEFPADVIESARQEPALAHPLLDRTEWMFN